MSFGPERQQHNENDAARAYPTSPWTEAYQAMNDSAPSADPDDDCADQTAKHSASAMPQTARPSFDSEDQRPTHDALSTIYNHGY